jgi:hypothetical protein
MLCRHRPDDDVAAIGANALELGNAGKIDQMLRSSEPQFHHGNKAMPAGERAALLAELGKQANGFPDRCWSMICKGGRYHMPPP